MHCLCFFLVIPVKIFAIFCNLKIDPLGVCLLMLAYGGFLGWVGLGAGSA